MTNRSNRNTPLRGPSSEIKVQAVPGTEMRRGGKQTNRDRQQSGSDISEPRGFLDEFGRATRASYRFLQREQARKSWFIFVVCVAFASIPWTVHWHELRTGSIVLAGVAAGAIFMPELNAGLWRLKSREIKDMIPQHKRRAFYAELIRADCPDKEWANLVWSQDVKPLLDAAQDTRRVHWEVTYEVSVRVDCEVHIQGRDQLMAWVETRNEYDCILPNTNNGISWISIAGDEASLKSEFGEPGCLSRELVALPDLTVEGWADEIRRLCGVMVRIGTRSIEFNADDIVTVHGTGKLRVIRWLFPLRQDEMSGSRERIQIEIDFPTKSHRNNFPLLLAGYYCAGRTALSFKFYHGQRDRPTLRYFGEFLSEGGHNIASWKPERLDNPERQAVVYRTPHDSLLWPGSGIYCWWESE